MMSLLDITPEVELVMTDGYTGHSKLIVQANFGEVVVVFPTEQEAVRAAHLAVHPVAGGYSSARVEMTTDAVSYETAEDWFFS